MNCTFLMSSAVLPWWYLWIFQVLWPSLFLDFMICQADRSIIFENWENIAFWITTLMWLQIILLWWDWTDEGMKCVWILSKSVFNYTLFLPFSQNRKADKNFTDLEHNMEWQATHSNFCYARWDSDRQCPPDYIAKKNLRYLPCIQVLWKKFWVELSRNFHQTYRSWFSGWQ